MAEPNVVVKKSIPFFKNVNWWKLAGLTIANSALASAGASTFPELLDKVSTNPKATAKLAGIGAALGALNLLMSVQKESTVTYESPKDTQAPLFEKD